MKNYKNAHKVFLTFQYKNSDEISTSFKVCPNKKAAELQREFDREWVTQHGHTFLSSDIQKVN